MSFFHVPKNIKAMAGLYLKKGMQISLDALPLGMTAKRVAELVEQGLLVAVESPAKGPVKTIHNAAELVAEGMEDLGVVPKDDPQTAKEELEAEAPGEEKPKPEKPSSKKKME